MNFFFKEIILQWLIAIKYENNSKILKLYYNFWKKENDLKILKNIIMTSLLYLLLIPKNFF